MSNTVFDHVTPNKWANLAGNAGQSDKISKLRHSVAIIMQDNVPGLKHEEEKAKRGLSRKLIFAILQALSNTTLHCIILAAIPCSPHFPSAFFLHCKSTGDRDFRWFQILPFFLYEHLPVGIVIFILSFNWVQVFMGLNWVSRHLRRHRANRKKLVWYREAELIMNSLNSSFHIYLSLFPTMLLAISGLMVFATIRLWHTDPSSTIIFPACGFRCTFECVTLLTMAGRVNQQSRLIKWDWLRYKGSKEQERFKRSCQTIKCGAGGLFSFENSIVIVSLDNVNQLVFALLVAFP